MTDIFNKLNDIKSKLAELDKNIVVEIKKEKEENLYKNRMDSKLPKVIESQLSKIYLNIGNEIFLTCSLSSFINFPYKLSLKEEVMNYSRSNSKQNPIFIDSSESLFFPIIEIIRCLSNNPDFEQIKTITVSSCPHSVEKHCKEFFLEDTEKVLSRFSFVFKPFWIKSQKAQKKTKLTNKWKSDAYILCYACGGQNDGTFWRKRCSYDRADDSYCIEFYIATCMNCDPDNTLTY